MIHVTEKYAKKRTERRKNKRLETSLKCKRKKERKGIHSRLKKGMK